MPRSRKSYAPEFRQQMVDLVRAGRTPEESSREYEPTAQSIWNWVRQAERDGGIRQDDLTTEEKAARDLRLGRLRRPKLTMRGAGDRESPRLARGNAHAHMTYTPPCSFADDQVTGARSARAECKRDYQEPSGRMQSV
jgi:transposase